MPTDSDVLDVVQAWSGKRPTKMSQSLEDWWNQTAPGSSHSTLPFAPDGIQDLVTRIDNAFPDADPIGTEDLGSSGSIKTVQDLVNALNEPGPPAAGAGKKLAAKKAAHKAGKKAAAKKKAVKTVAKKRPAIKSSGKKSASKGTNRG